MPNAIKASPTTPCTSRDEPLITCPAASSTVPVAKTAPGKNATSGGISARIGILGLEELGGAEHRGADEKRGQHRHERLQGDESPRGQRSHREAEHECHQQAAPRRLQEQRETDAEHSVAEDADQPTARWRCDQDLVETCQAVRGRQLVAFERGSEEIDLTDLVEPRDHMATAHAELHRASDASPTCTRSVVGSTAISRFLSPRRLADAIEPVLRRIYRLAGDRHRDADPDDELLELAQLVVRELSHQTSAAQREAVGRTDVIDRANAVASARLLTPSFR